MTSIAVVLGLQGLLLAPEETVAPSEVVLVEMLRDGQHPRSQSQAALLLLTLRSGEAEKAIREGLKQHEEAGIFLALSSAIGLTRDRRFNPDLLAALSASRPAVRQSAAETLALLVDPALARELESLATDRGHDLALRQLALWTLGRAGSQEATAVLIRQLRSDQEALREVAAQALEGLTGQPWGKDTRLWEAWWEKQKGLSPERWLARRLAFQSIRSGRLQGDLARAQAQVLGLHQRLYTHLPAAERMGHIQAVAEQQDPAVRLLAVQWCQELLTPGDSARQPQLGQVLLRLSQDSSVEVQRAAVLVLGRLTEPEGFKLLLQLLRRGEPPVRAAAARSLALQARGTSPEALERRRVVVPLLQEALEDPALEVVIEAAEDLGALGVPEAGPVLTGLLRHASESVRQTAAQALERSADHAVLDSLLLLPEDPSVTVRFSLVGALARAVGEGRGLSEGQRARVLARLEKLFQKDTDPGVRSRAATALGECAPPELLPLLWKCVRGSEDSRVQEKAWAAMIRIIVRSESADLLHDWDRLITEARQGPRRLQLLGEVLGHWQKKPEMHAAAAAVQELFITAQLDQGKWAAALPLLREMLARAGTEQARNRTLAWLLSAARQALREDQRDEVLRILQEVRPLLPREGPLRDDFDALGREVRPQ